MDKRVPLTVRCSYATSVQPTARVCELASMFGLGVDGRRRIEVVPQVTLALGRGEVVYITGASGGGKSTLLRLVGEQLGRHAAASVIDFASSGEGETGRPLVELAGPTLADATRRLALAGLNDAFVMLRRPAELSDGQRYRYRLARAIGACEDLPPSGDRSWAVVLADEFGSTLDRLTAQVIARNVRRWTRRSGATFIACTAHDDLLEALDPDTLVVQEPGRAIEVRERPAGDAARG